MSPGPRIQKLHIKEFSRKKADTQGLWKGFDVKLLEGDNNWPAVMKALDEVGYHGWAMTEQPGGDTPEGLRDLADRFTKILCLLSHYEAQPEEGNVVSRRDGQDPAGEVPGRKAAGFDGIEPPSHLDQEEVLRARDATGLGIPDVSCGNPSRGLTDPDASKRAEAVEGLKQALRDAKR